MFKVMKRAGVSVDEAAFVLGLSRAAVYNWQRGTAQPHKLLKGRVLRFEIFLEHLVSKRQLPFKEGTDLETRRLRIEKMKAAFDRFGTK